MRYRRRLPREFFNRIECTADDQQNFSVIEISPAALHARTCSREIQILTHLMAENGRGCVKRALILMSLGQRTTLAMDCRRLGTSGPTLVTFQSKRSSDLPPAFVILRFHTASASFGRWECFTGASPEMSRLGVVLHAMARWWL